MYEDVKPIRTYAEADAYFNKTKPFVKGKSKGKVPIGNRNRGWLNLSKTSSGYVLNFSAYGNGIEGKRTITYDQANPLVATVDLRNYAIFDLCVLSSIMGTSMFQYLHEVWCYNRNSSDWQYLGRGVHEFVSGMPPHKLMTKTYLKRKEFSALCKPIKPFVDYLTITNKIRDKGFSYEEIKSRDTTNWNGGVLDLLTLIRSDNIEDWYTASLIIARNNGESMTEGMDYGNHFWRNTGVLGGDALTKKMVKHVKEAIKTKHAKELFYQKQVETKGLSQDSNRRYGYELNK
jgi:hypothetical protein